MARSLNPNDKDPSLGTPPRRPRQGRSNDCSDAGEGHRRSDRCSNRCDGGGRGKRPSDYRRDSNDFGRRGTDGRSRPEEVRSEEKASEDQIDAVIDAMVEAGVNVHRTTGATQTILAGVGPTAGVDLRKVELLPAGR